MIWIGLFTYKILIDHFITEIFAKYHNFRLPPHFPDRTAWKASRHLMWDFQTCLIFDSKNFVAFHKLSMSEAYARTVSISSVWLRLALKAKSLRLVRSKWITKILYRVSWNLWSYMKLAAVKMFGINCVLSLIVFFVCFEDQAAVKNYTLPIVYHKRTNSNLTILIQYHKKKIIDKCRTDQRQFWHEYKIFSKTRTLNWWQPKLNNLYTFNWRHYCVWSVKSQTKQFFGQWMFQELR